MFGLVHLVKGGIRFLCILALFATEKLRVIISGTIPRFVHKDKKDGNFIRDVDVCEVVSRNDYRIVSVEMDKLKIARNLSIDIDTAKFSKSTQRLIEIVRKYGLNLPS